MPHNASFLFFLDLFIFFSPWLSPHCLYLCIPNSSFFFLFFIFFFCHFQTSSKESLARPPNSKRPSLVAHQEKDRVQDFAFDSVSLTSVPFGFSFPLLFYFGILLFFSILFSECVFFGSCFSYYLIVSYRVQKLLIVYLYLSL